MISIKKFSFNQNHSELSAPDVDSKSDVLHVFAISGMIGFLAALLGRVNWQVSIESAQVVSGIVQYADKSPFYLFHTKVWSLLTQIPAFFLFLGVTERSLSIVISGFAGAFSFQALSLIIYAVSNRKLLALLSPMFIYITGATSVFESNHPIYLMGATHTYGMISLSFVIMSLALISLRVYKIGWILIGIATGMHAIVGGIAILGAIIAVIWEECFSYLKTILPYLVSGILLASLSYLYQVIAIYDVPIVDSGISEKYVAAFIQHWDTHRARIPILSVSILINVLIIFLSFTACNKLPEYVEYSGKFLLRAFSAIAILGIFFTLLGWLLTGHIIPPVLMPSKLLNFAAFGAMALLIGLLAVQEDNIYRYLLAAMVVIPLVWYGVERNMDIIKPLVIFTLITSIVLIFRQGGKIGRSQQNPLVLLDIVIISVLLVVLAGGLLKGALQAKERFALLTNWTDDKVYSEASKSKGMLLTPFEMRLVQLRTRRPVLLDALNQIPYVPESAEPINNILQKIYGINLLAPPDQRSNVVQSGELLVNINKTIWEQRSYDEWLKIAHEFNVSDVIAYKDWKLRLPIVVDNEIMTLYRLERN
jgi:hypothetical protein